MREALLGHPNLQRRRRIASSTRNAAPLYARYGFTTAVPASAYMELRRSP